MFSSPASKRLLDLFERDLRSSSTDRSTTNPAPQPRPKALSVELDHQVVEFAAQVRTSGCTPEQMLINLKQLLSSAAPEVPSSERSAFVSSVTGRAIASFFGVQTRSRTNKSTPDGGEQHGR